jgi:hypothetical protein
LLINTKVGQWLFPYSYANRAVNFTYDPNSFLHLLQPVLRARRTQPLFLAVHFCLPHHPYIWADIHASEYSALSRYQASIVRVDTQLKDFFAALKANHLLDHAIVVMLSDHGEALELLGDRITEKDAFLSEQRIATHIPQFYPPSLDNEEVNQSAGHGTDVLALSQYHTLLAFRLYGVGHSQQKTIPGVVSLLAVKPTLLSLIGLATHTKWVAPSLAPLIRGESDAMMRTPPIFLESDYTPQAIRTVYPEVRQVVLEGVQLFQIDPKTTLLTTKPSMGEMIIRSKQYAAIEGEWMLALYPQNKEMRLPVLINLSSGKWTTDLHSAFAKQAKAMQLLAHLKQFYGTEIKKVQISNKM